MALPGFITKTSVITWAVLGFFVFCALSAFVLSMGTKASGTFSFVSTTNSGAAGHGTAPVTPREHVPSPGGSE